MKLKVKRVHPDAIIPRYATEGAACFDLHSIEKYWFEGTSRATLRTGLCFEVPPNWVMLIFSRSGHGFKNATRLVNCVGVIDSDYRGEILVGLHHESVDLFKVKPGDRIAQAMLLPLPPQVEMLLCDTLSETARGDGGFGSTDNGVTDYD